MKTNQRRKRTGKRTGSIVQNFSRAANTDSGMQDQDEAASFAIRAHVEIARRSRCAFPPVILLDYEANQEAGSKEARNKLIIDPSAPPCIHHAAGGGYGPQQMSCLAVSLSLSFSLFVSILIAVTVRDRSHYRLSIVSATFSHHHHHPAGEENAARCVCGLRTLALVRLARLRIISQRLFINAWSLAWRTGSSTSWAMDALTGPD